MTVSFRAWLRFAFVLVSNPNCEVNIWTEQVNIFQSQATPLNYIKEGEAK